MRNHIEERVNTKSLAQPDYYLTKVGELVATAIQEKS